MQQARRITPGRMAFALVLVALMWGAAPAMQATGQLEVYAQTPYAVGNIAYDWHGGLIYSAHPFYAPKARVLRYDQASGQSTPYPDEAWNTRREGDDQFLDDVLGIRNDSRGVVWILDMGMKSGVTPKLVGWNTRENRLERIYYIPSPASIKTSQLNDFAFDEQRGIVVIADEEIANGGDGSKAALVVLDMKTGVSRRLLQGHWSTRAEDRPIVVNGRQLNIPGTDRPIHVGADGIALDKDNEWLYYAPLNGATVYRVRMADLLSTPENRLDDKIERYAAKENNGGLSVDMKGNLYLTYIESNAVGVISPGGREARRFAEDPGMLWPDGISFNKDGYMYVSAAQLPLAAPFNNGKDETKQPFLIFRFRPLAAGVWGR